MKKTIPVSEEMLNAFIDNELEDEERNLIIEMESENKELAEAICEARKLKALVTAARTKEPLDVMHNYSNKKRVGKSYFVAASFILALGIIVFSVIDQKYNNMTYTTNTKYNNSHSMLVAEKEQKNLNLILHFQTADSKHVSDLFNILNTALQNSNRHQNNLHVEVLLSGDGLELVQKDSYYIRTIKAIGKNNKNVTFIACGKTLQNLQTNSNKNIRIIKEAMLVSSGTSWAKKRQQQGWSYLTI